MEVEGVATEFQRRQMARVKNGRFSENTDKFHKQGETGSGGGYAVFLGCGV
jgi:hypothetical protein